MGIYTTQVFPHFTLLLLLLHIPNTHLKCASRSFMETLEEAQFLALWLADGLHLRLQAVLPNFMRRGWRWMVQGSTQVPPRSSLNTV
jgi:hypothetical protein